MSLQACLTGLTPFRLSSAPLIRRGPPPAAPVQSSRLTSRAPTLLQGVPNVVLHFHTPRLSTSGVATARQPLGPSFGWLRKRLPWASTSPTRNQEGEAPDVITTVMSDGLRPCVLPPSTGSGMQLAPHLSDSRLRLPATPPVNRVGWRASTRFHRKLGAPLSPDSVARSHAEQNRWHYSVYSVDGFFTKVDSPCTDATNQTYDVHPFGVIQI